MDAIKHEFAKRAWLVGVLPPGLFAGLLLSALLLIYPLNMFPEMPGGSKYLILPLIIIAGAMSAVRLGLRFAAGSWRENVWIPLLASFAMGAAILRYDPMSLAATDYTSLLYYPPKAAAEELIYRLGVTSCIAFMLSGSSWKRTSLAVSVMLAATLAQTINIVLNVPLPAQNLDYTVIRYLLPGVLWGWLYLRYGFLSAVIGHVGTHIWLDPVLAYVR
jgi:hypothetical protein